MKAKIINFVNEVKSELTKVTWPAKDILKKSTIVVIVLMFLVAMCIGIVDVIFSKSITLLMK